jgi:hypothetical protein
VTGKDEVDRSTGAELTTRSAKMNREIGPAVVFLIVGIVFFIVGLHTIPRNNTYLILGIAFALIAAIQFRRARAGQ